MVESYWSTYAWRNDCVFNFVDYFGKDRETSAKFNKMPGDDVELTTFWKHSYYGIKFPEEKPGQGCFNGEAKQVDIVLSPDNEGEDSDEKRSGFVCASRAHVVKGVLLAQSLFHAASNLLLSYMVKVDPKENWNQGWFKTAQQSAMARGGDPNQKYMLFANGVKAVVTHLINQEHAPHHILLGGVEADTKSATAIDAQVKLAVKVKSSAFQTGDMVDPSEEGIITKYPASACNTGECDVGLFVWMMDPDAANKIAPAGRRNLKSIFDCNPTPATTPGATVSKNEGKAASELRHCGLYC